MKKYLFFLLILFSLAQSFAANAEFSYNGNVFCQSLGVPLIPVHSNGGTDGTYSATTLSGAGNLVFNPVTGIIDLTASPAGTYMVTNAIAPTLLDPLGDVFQQTVIIAPTPDATFAYNGLAFCIGENNPIITSAPNNANFSYTSATGGMLNIDTLTGYIDLATSTAGTFTISSTAAAIGGCASHTFSQTITLNSQADPEFQYDMAAYCKTGTNPVLQHNTGIDGTYSFAVISGGPALNLSPASGYIQLASSDFGTYLVTNSHAASGACAAVSHTETVVIESAPDAEFHYDKTTYCGLYSIPLVLHVSGINGYYSYQTLSGGPTLLLNPNTGAIDLLFTNNGTYLVTNIVESQGVCAADTHKVQVTYANTPVASIFPTGNFDLCNLDSLLMTSNGGMSYIWLKNTLSQGVVNDSFVVNTPGNYSVIAYNEYNCSDTSEIVSIFQNAQPNADILTGPVLICSGQVTTIVGDGTGLSFQWLQNGDSVLGATGQSFTVTEGGFYTFIAQNACGFDSSSVYITQSNGLFADFFVENETLYAGIPAHFRDQSVNAAQWAWQYGDGEFGEAQNPNYSFGDTGHYVVTMIVTDRFGCQDTAIDTVLVRSFLEDDLFVPNIFSPNDDGIFDALQVKAEGMAIFDLQIFDRWGKKVFISNNPNKSWEGRNLDGLNCNTGVYYFVLKGQDGVGNAIQRQGNVLLVK